MCCCLVMYSGISSWWMLGRWSLRLTQSALSVKCCSAWCSQPVACTTRLMSEVNPLHTRVPISRSKGGVSPRTFYERKRSGYHSYYLHLFIFPKTFYRDTPPMERYDACKWHNVPMNADPCRLRPEGLMGLLVIHTYEQNRYPPEFMKLRPNCRYGKGSEALQGSLPCGGPCGR